MTDRHTTDRRRRRAVGRLGATTALLVAAVVFAGCTLDNDQNSLDPQGKPATQIFHLFIPFAIIAVIIGVLVTGAVIYAAIRFRARSDDDAPRQVHGNTPLEVGWTIAPAVLLAVMAVPTVSLIFQQAEKPPDALEITVTGKQWWWQYEYVDEGFVTANEMHIPAGRDVYLTLESDNVIHSFWVPNLAGKKDVLPAASNTLTIEADDPGLYLGQCAEYCGLSHANMRLRVFADTEADYEAWVADQKGSLDQQQLDFVDGDLLTTTYGCTNCHVFEPDAKGVGPNLTHLASRTTFAGATYDLTEDNLRRWVKNAPSMKPMQTGDQPGAAPSTAAAVPGMPPFPNMTDADRDEIVAFLLSLE